MTDHADDFDEELEIEQEVTCPKCGAGFAEILRRPQPGKWWGRYGKARCGYCGVIFEVVLELLDEDNEEGTPGQDPDPEF